ncbi:MAG: redox-sensing transcriptional repressor Rex [Actinobacteria bacterium]|nr:redox-sensing transcriptional repressor Rex [Actinomycetota bacterium]MCB8998129.1 redox-sensing transcriptional repressor Rex [Actinomycetota bacterium]MCB9415430.1 redox-sensing transcriptional repressor Rex [Actinomycetota bacterium]HRY09636.1 redox-sensing transcriptional repressor Rex [Candidatus Nanopelagicales bacterium]
MSLPRLRRRELPDATIARLPQYIRCLSQLENAGLRTVHSADLAAHVGVSGAVVRRDLSYVGSYGTRGVGYPVSELRDSVNRALGLATEHRMVIVGVGHMGRAIAGYTGFAERGLRVVGLFDIDPELIGSKAGNPGSEVLEIMPLADLAAFVHTNDVAIAVVATPASAAQSVADLLVDAGITSILNLSAVHLSVPDTVVVRPVDLATEIQILAVHAAARGRR